MMQHYKIATLIPYVDDIYCKAVLGEKITHKQLASNHGKYREININYNRHELQEYVKFNITGIDLVLLMDSDVIATKTQLNALVKAFKGDPIALKTKDYDTGKHICCACCLMKFEDYLKIDYINTYVDMCQCSKIANLFNVSYLEGHQATEYHKTYKESSNIHKVSVRPYVRIPSKEVENGGQ